MSEGSLSGGGTIMSTADWGYPSSHYNSNDYSIQDFYNFDDDDEDDLDSYYMDLPPIDMTERLKEVNRALAEDSTPIESNRKTKLRFREVIADFQSPRESVLLSDSDDGYGDSSDIMYDADEDNDILFSSSSTPNRDTEIRGVSSITPQCDRVDSSQPPTTQRSNSEESVKQKDHNIEVKKLLFSSWVSAPESSSTSVSAFENKLEVVKPILKCDSASEKVILEDVLSSDSCCDVGSLKGGGNSSIFKASNSNATGVSFLTDNNKESAQKYMVPSNSNGRFSKCSKKDFSELDSEIEEEIEVFNKAYARNESLTDDNISDENTESRPSLHQYDDTSIISGTKVKHKAQKELENRYVVDNKDSSSLSEDSIILELSQNKSTSRESKANVGNCINITTECDKSSKPKKISKVKVTSDRSPTKTAKTKPNVRLSSSQPIPTIKSSLISTQKLPFTSLNKNSKGSRTHSPSSNIVNNFVRPSRSRTIEYSRTTSPTKSPLSNPVQSTRPLTARKGSPLPRRSSRFYEKKPVKAIHNQSHSIPPEPAKPFKMLPNSSLGSKVRKAASTSDLSRGGFEEQQQMNDAVFERWLQGKTRHANLNKKQKEDSKHVEDAVANAKLQERKRLAEEAFQQWLRRKREQLKEEKLGRAQQRKLEQQANYARTRTQCEEAYKEWCKRKQEELSASRRISGSSTNGRSRSLERTWIQEKTRKLYRAYLTTH